MSETILDRLFLAADNHAEDSGEPDHAVGDLQDMFRLAWNVLSHAQRIELLRKPEMEDIVEMGARAEFSADSLAHELDAEISDMDAQVAAAGYQIMEGEGWFYWENDQTDESSEDFAARADAVASAYQDMKERQA